MENFSKFCSLRIVLHQNTRLTLFQKLFDYRRAKEKFMNFVLSVHPLNSEKILTGFMDCFNGAFSQRYSILKHQPSFCLIKSFFVHKLLISA